jgi:alpha-L-rhamnosidase
MLKIENLRINHLTDPVGVTVPLCVSWNLVSDEKNVVQAGYRICISLNPDSSDPCFVLERTGAESSEIGLDIENLRECTTYYVSVQVTTTSGVIPDLCRAQFTTAILNTASWKAGFISAETADSGRKSKGTYIRKKISFSEKPEKVYALASSLGLYELYINSTKVGNDVLTPGWTSYDYRLSCQMYDVTSLIKAGENAAGMLIGPGWYKGELAFYKNRNVYGRQTAGFVQFVCIYKNGSREEFGTDATWKGNDSPLVFSEIYHGETYDAGLYDELWCTPGFDDTGWRNVSVVPYDVKKLVPQAGCRVKTQERFPAQKIFRTPEGDTVVDFGQNLAGWVEFSTAAPAGTKLQFQCFEVLDSSGNVYTENLRRAKQTITYYCKGLGCETFHPFFSWQGFRYITLIHWCGKPVLSQFTAVAVHSDMERTGEFSCSNELINRLQHNILWGMKSNFLDIPTDCPQRNERLGWTGDSQIFCSTASFLMDTEVFYIKWLKDVACDQYSNGEIPHVVPDCITKIGGCKDNGSSGSAGWADAAVINTWNVYLTYGSKQVIRDQYACMKEFIDWMYQCTKTNSWPMDRQYGDWVALDAKPGSYKGATPDTLICYAYEYYSTSLFAKMGSAAGYTAESVKYEGTAAKIKTLFQKKFFKTDGTLRVQTQTAYILSLYFNLVPETFRKKTVEGLLEILKRYNGHLATGFIGTPYFCHALSRNGCTREAYALLMKEDFPSWLYQIKKGATTIWEHWDGLKDDGTMWSPDMNSFNHYAYGSVGDWLYKECAGLRPDENVPGYKHFFINPHTGGGLTWAEISYKSIYGLIKIRWECKSGNTELSFSIPANTSADIMLDSCSETIKTDGLVFRVTDRGYTGTAGSGEYTVVYKSC